MRAFLWWAFVVVAFTPFALMLLLLAEARFPALDAVTLTLPAPVRALAGEIAMVSVGYGKDSGSKLDRVLKLDPENAQAWTRRCSSSVNSDAGEALTACRKAVALAPAELNFNGLGLAQEKAKDFCAAEDSFTEANSKVNARDSFVLSNLGRAALKCGHAPAAVASFEIAEIKDSQEAAVARANGGDDEDEAEAKDTLRTDREWLVVAYGRNGEMQKAGAMCTSAHPDWRGCACNWNDQGVKCEPAGGKR